MASMKSFRVCVLFLFLSRYYFSCFADDVVVTVRGMTNIATTDDIFVCATLDWWPTAKCNYNQCPWGESGILNLDLNNKILSNAMKAFGSIRIRIGGSIQDQVIYKLGNATKQCPLKSFENKTDGLFGFGNGCLSMEKWDEINTFLEQAGAVVTFGLNALIGRTKIPQSGNLYGGDWNPRNAHDFIKYTVQKGYKIDSWEFGNELCGGGIAARVEAQQYAKDAIVLKKLINKLYRKSATKPKLLAPGGFYDAKWFATFLNESGPNVVDGITHHIYNLGPGVDPELIDKIQSPFYLEGSVVPTYRNIENTIQTFGPWSSAWIGESGGAFNSGGKDVSHTFVNSFWYLDQLGMTSTYQHKVFCRQTFIGGNYGLLNYTNFIPNPDYYSALLWHRLMGKQVLSTNHTGSPYLRVYSHCSRTKPGITVLLINLSNSTTFNVSIYNNDFNLSPNGGININEGIKQREEYHLTPKDGNIQSDVMLLNGTPLLLTETSDIPPLKPILVDGLSPTHVASDSIVFVTVRDFKAPACF